jgi:DNA-binding NtrC family response regulator
MNRIMLIDDEENILRALRRVLTGKDREIEDFTDPVEALRRARVATFDLFVSDFRMPGMTGAQLLTEIRQLQPEAMRIILSGYADLESVLAAINEAQIYRFICKPWQDHDLKMAVVQALEHRAMLAENRRLADQVRHQQEALAKQRTALERLEAEHPELTRIEWGPDGSIPLNEHDI